MGKVHKYEHKAKGKFTYEEILKLFISYASLKMVPLTFIDSLFFYGPFKELYPLCELGREFIKLIDNEANFDLVTTISGNEKNNKIDCNNNIIIEDDLPDYIEEFELLAYDLNHFKYFIAKDPKDITMPYPEETKKKKNNKNKKKKKNKNKNKNIKIEEIACKTDAANDKIETDLTTKKMDEIIKNEPLIPSNFPESKIPEEILQEEAEKIEEIQPAAEKEIPKIEVKPIPPIKIKKTKKQKKEKKKEGDNDEHANITPVKFNNEITFFEGTNTKDAEDEYLNIQENVAKMFSSTQVGSQERAVKKTPKKNKKNAKKKAVLPSKNVEHVSTPKAITPPPEEPIYSASAFTPSTNSNPQDDSSESCFFTKLNEEIKIEVERTDFFIFHLKPICKVLLKNFENLAKVVFSSRSSKLT